MEAPKRPALADSTVCLSKILTNRSISTFRRARSIQMPSIWYLPGRMTSSMVKPTSAFRSTIYRRSSGGWSRPARKFLVLNLPPLGYTPRYNVNPTTFAQYNTLSANFNTSLWAMLDNLEASNPALTIRRADVASLFAQAIANPAAFGLTNVTSAAAPGLEPGASSYNTSQIVTHPEQYLFWDDLHPTTTVHADLAQYALVQLRLPGDIDRTGHVDVGDVSAMMGGGLERL